MNEQQQLKHEAAAERAAQLRRDRLIDAAPELLATLGVVTEALPTLIKAAQIANYPEDQRKAFWEMLDDCKAAIAKAEGCCQYHESGGDISLSCGGDIAT